MKKSVNDLLQEYNAQSNENADQQEAKAYCCGCGDDQSFDCCQLCGALTCVSCCEAMC